MSKERKPGSRGGMDPSSPDRVSPGPSVGSEPGSHKPSKTKGPTKTAPRKKGFKKKPSK